MSYEEFVAAITKEIKRIFPEKITTKCIKVTKNNGVELEALLIESKKAKISPNYYLSIYYQEFLDGKTVEEIGQEMKAVYENTTEEMKNYSFNLSLENCRDKIVFRLVSYEKNKSLTSQIPYVPFLDMMITFHVLAKQEEDGIGTIRVTNDLMEQWGIDEELLFLLAQENTPKLFPLTICTMMSVIQDMLTKKDRKVQEDLSHREEDTGKKQDPYVITNKKGINGAAAVLYPDTLSKVQKIVGENFYVLPSSIHELLVVPESSFLSELELREMVREVNETCVSKEEILSDQVYYYENLTDTISICACS